MSEKELDALVNKFLTWPLPKSVCADRCASMPDYEYQRSGTNLLTASEAKEMLRHVLSASEVSTERERCAMLADAKGINSCELGGTDPSTGTFECRRLDRGDCNCAEFDELAAAIRLLTQEQP